MNRGGFEVEIYDIHVLMATNIVQKDLVLSCDVRNCLAGTKGTRLLLNNDLSLSRYISDHGHRGGE